MDLTEPDDDRLLSDYVQYAQKADEIWAHEAGFDRTILETTDWWPKVPLEKWRCTAALARMHGLPGGLDKLCQIFRVKDDDANILRVKHSSNCSVSLIRTEDTTTVIVIQPNGQKFLGTGPQIFPQCGQCGRPLLNGTVHPDCGPDGT